MNAELVFFGRVISMAQRSRRRALVAIIYAMLAALLIASYGMNHWRAVSPYVILVVLLACRAFLGGYYAGGLVKPFKMREEREFEGPPHLLALKLRVYRPMSAAGADAIRSDERELSQRDRAHYRAYQILGVSLVVPWIALSVLGDSSLFGWSATNINRLCAGLLAAILTLFLTLPQVIMLWNEPDMEPEA